MTTLSNSQLFEWPIRVYYEDTDAGGVVFYANYLRFMERARTEWLRHLGFEQDELMQDPGVMFAVYRTEIDYRAPARFNDELSVITRVDKLSGASITFAQQIVRRGDDQPLVEGLVQVACVTIEMKPARIPSSIKDLLKTA
jgi:acyl-CoA thioester hydrolase